jgi:uncharacterized membrane protein YGL010W
MIRTILFMCLLHNNTVCTCITALQVPSLNLVIVGVQVFYLINLFLQFTVHTLLSAKKEIFH